ncbi:MAG: SCO family protein [Novosphingobium sp.]
MNRRAMLKPNLLFLLPLLAASAACQQPAAAPAAPQIEGTALDGSGIGGPFTLIGKDGQQVSWDQFKGKYRIVYFGYTFCPDVCPLDLGRMMQGYLKFAEQHRDLADQIQPIFITIDPARDTPERVGQYAANFTPKLLGLTGSQAQIDAAVAAFKVSATRGEDRPGGYLMNHSRFAYLMDRDGKPLEALPIDKGPEAVAADLARQVR